MKIDIDRFGLKNVQVDPDLQFYFPEGMLGFEAFKHFQIFHQEGQPMVFWLQSLVDASLMFPMVNPEQLEMEYEIELSDADCTLLELKSASDAVVAIMIYRDATAVAEGSIAANTRSPIILNPKNRKGMQKILQEVHPSLLYRAR